MASRAQEKARPRRAQEPQSKLSGISVLETPAKLCTEEHDLLISMLENEMEENSTSASPATGYTVSGFALLSDEQATPADVTVDLEVLAQDDATAACKDVSVTGAQSIAFADNLENVETRGSAEEHDLLISILNDEFDSQAGHWQINNTEDFINLVRRQQLQENE